MEFNEWLQQYRAAKKIEELANSPQDTPEKREELRHSALQLALHNPDLASAIGLALTEQENQLAFLENQAKIDKVMLTARELYATRALDSYKLNKDTFLNSVPEKGLAKIVLGVNAPELGDSKEDKNYGSLVKKHYQFNQIDKLLKEKDTEIGEAKIRKNAESIMEESVETLTKNDSFYERNPDMKELLLNLGYQFITNGNAKAYLAGKANKLGTEILETIKDEKARAEYARYVISRSEDEKAMEYLFDATRAAA